MLVHIAVGGVTSYDSRRSGQGSCHFSSTASSVVGRGLGSVFDRERETEKQLCLRKFRRDSGSSEVNMFMSSCGRARFRGLSSRPWNRTGTGSRGVHSLFVLYRSSSLLERIISISVNDKTFREARCYGHKMSP